ncbi:MAG: hydroxymethylbilane synthase, partial [Elusimicrobia bacterium HGW-Elusimicrobia-3]
ERLGQSDVGAPLAWDEWIPAAAQGVIAIECRADDVATTALLAAIDDAPTRAELEAERALLAQLGGTCHSPVAVLCETGGGALVMRAALFSPDGVERIEGTVTFAPHDHAPIRALAADLLARATPGIAPHFRKHQ